MAITLDKRATAEQLMAVLDHVKPGANSSLVELAWCIEAVQRAVYLLAFDAFAEQADSYPVTIQSLLSRPDPELSIDRDALVEPQEVLGFAEVIDMLSHQQLSCVAPRLHRGWQDKKQSCRETRQLSSGAVGTSLDQTERDGLLAGLAIRNRVFVLPPPLTVDVAQAREALAPLLALVKRIAEHRGAGRIAQLASDAL